MLYIRKLDKVTKKETALTVHQFAKELGTEMGDKTHYQKMLSLMAVIDGSMVQNSEVAYYIREAK